jgi:hypothetical protein
VRASRHEPRVLSGDWPALIASGRGSAPRLEEGPDGFSGDTSGTADRPAVTARSSARIGPHGDSIKPALFDIRHLITAAVGRCALFHPAAIATQYPLDRHEQFVRDFDRRVAEGFRNQMLIGMMVETHISKSKYRHVIASIKLLTAAAPLGSAYVAALGIIT